MQEKSLIKQNILQYIDYKGISKYKFYQESGITRGVLDQNNGMSEENTAKFLAQFPDVNPTWLLTGTGEMLLNHTNIENSFIPNEVSEEGGGKRYPLVNATAVGGFGNSNFAIEERDVKDYYVIPKFQHKQIDFMIEVEGSSMYPKYNSGDVVACRIINEKSFIQWNKTHVIATRDQGIIIKRIKPGSELTLLKMVSDNKDYDSFEINTEDISGVALVVGVIRLE